MLDIIIPIYNASNTLSDTLYSISYQSISDKVTVYLVDDASSENYSEIIDKFSHLLNIKYLRLDKNVGPGAAREYGIQHSNGKYLMFMDSDDSFFDPFSLVYLYEVIDNEKADVVVTDFYEETSSTLELHKMNYTWFHGKIYRRKFIEKNDIHINNTRRNEDEGFNQLCFLLSDHIVYKETSTYIWRNNKDSLTRRNLEEFRLKSLYDYAYNIKYAIECSLKIKNNGDRIGCLSYKALLYIFFYYLENREKVKFDKFNDSLIYLKNAYLNNKIKEEDKIEIYKNQYFTCLNVVGMTKLTDMDMTFTDFLNKIGSESK